MTSRTIEIFNSGLLIEVFQATRNILIWQHIGDEIDFLKSQKHYTKSLYSFVQQSAQTNFILSLGKLYDKPTNKYPTQCILYFMQQIKVDAHNAAEIIEKNITKKLLEEYNFPDSLIHAVNDPDKSIFPKLFSDYYLDKYNDTRVHFKFSH